MNYQRAIAWLAGPLSALVGVVSTSVVHSTISHATALSVSTFALSAAATYLGHAKWMSNLVEWWDHETKPAAAVTTPGDPVIAPGAGFVFDDPPEPNFRLARPGDAPTGEADRLRAQLRQHGLTPLA